MFRSVPLHTHAQVGAIAPQNNRSHMPSHAVIIFSTRDVHVNNWQRLFRSTLHWRLCSRIKICSARLCLWLNFWLISRYTQGTHSNVSLHRSNSSDHEPGFDVYRHLTKICNSHIELGLRPRHNNIGHFQTCACSKISGWSKQHRSFSPSCRDCRRNSHW